MMDENRIYSSLTYVETIFNVADCLRRVGKYSSSVRATAGKVEILMGIVFLLVRLTMEAQEKAETCLRLGVEFFGHGVLNYLRGNLAFDLDYGQKKDSTRGLVPIILLAVSVFKNESFGPLVEYGQFAKLMKIY